MVHFSCDLCGKGLDEATRYQLKIEIQTADDPSLLTEDDLEDEALEEVSQFLQDADEFEDFPEADLADQRLRFDLCPACKLKFLQDPLGKGSRRTAYFGDN